MNIGSWTPDQSVLVVAEIGNNHEGDLGLARDMIAAAAEAGADAVKLQTLAPETLVTADQQARRDQLARFALGDDAWPELAEVARANDVMFLSTPFDLRAVHLLDPLVPAFKIASGDLTFAPLLRAVAATAKPVILSTGLATDDEIAAAVAVLEKEWSAGGHPGLALLHCVSCYPTDAAQASLRRIPALLRHSEVVGYSDHTLGVRAASVAVALGARIIEKHFTIDRNLSDFRDHQLSVDPPQMRELVAGIRETEALMADEAEVASCEQDSRTAVRRSIAVGRDLAAGATIEASDLVWLRPATGFPPGEESQVVGRRIVRDLGAGTLITAADLA